MNIPEISVIMPVYNAESYLKESIQSILNQTYTNFELIICDDGSTDRSLEIIQAFRDERIRVIRNEQNLGIPLTLNRLIEACLGKYIARQDSDDISLPKRLEKQARFLEKNPQVGLCGTNFITFGHKNIRRLMPQKDEEIRAFLLINNPICQPTIMVRKTCLTKPYDQAYDLSEDYAHGYELSKITKLANLPDVLLKYRWHGTNISLTKEQIMIENANQIRANIFRETLGYDITEQETRLLRLATDSNLTDLNQLVLLEKFLKNIQLKNKISVYYNEQALNNLSFHFWASACMKFKGIGQAKKIRLMMKSELFSGSSLLHDLSFRHLRTVFLNLMQKSNTKTEVLT
ncbi:MAG: glycosyltransferase family 2 protein [Prolixibacteraceae bacterium]